MGLISIQVLVAFLISAWLSFGFVFFAYWCNLIPENLLTAFDMHFSNRTSHGSLRWQEALQKAVLIFSDQQIVTGIAVLTAGFVKMNGEKPISVYHWYTIVYLGWMSSNVHLASLTFLRTYIETNRWLRACRLVGMTAMFCLLFAALFPTSNYPFVMALNNEVHPWDFHDICWPMQLPAHCFWKIMGVPNERYLNVSQSPQVIWDWWHLTTSPDAVLSYFLLVSSYLWKVAMLFRLNQQTLIRWTHTLPLRLVEKPVRHLASNRGHWYQRLCYTLLLSIYVPMILVLHVCESFAGSLWLLGVGLIWGTMQLLQPRKHLPFDVRKQEDSWGFGQILPVLLLALPLLAVGEHFYGNASRIPGLQATLIFVAGNSEAISAETSLQDEQKKDTVELQRFTPDEQKLEQGIRDGNPTIRTTCGKTIPQSQPRHWTPFKVLTRQPMRGLRVLFVRLDFNDHTSSEALDLAIYQSRTFNAIAWVLNLTFAATAIAVFVSQALRAGEYTYIIVGYGIVGLVGATWLIALAASLWSRLYR